MWTLLPLHLEPLARQALLEDLGQGDMTTDALPQLAQRIGRFEVRPRQACVVAGLEMAQQVLTLVDPAIRFTPQAHCGDRLEPGAVMAVIEGPVAAILKAERTTLNFLQHLSGIATETRRFADCLTGTPARVTDTRKTTPGLRLLEKKAVVDGGGSPHRFNLGSAVMLKDNHLQALGLDPAQRAEWIRAMRQRIPHPARIEVEVDRLADVPAALEAGADILLLDNFTPEEVRQAVALIGNRALIEASGGITLETARAYAEAGAQFLSTSRITLGATPIDIGLDWVNPV
jgi:nicotinate-nucleotide pyrophosphorylase (carboxylating)